MYLIGNAHLDPVWLWRWQEGYAENNATMKSMLDRLNEFNEVIFTSSSAQFYEWIEENSAEMFNQIKERVAEGRWVICGGWWVQPDCNIPSGESFARHTLIAQNYFYNKFGKISDVGYCVDSFGHCGTLPQILKLSRMENYVFMRPSRAEKNIEENLFIWESDDGSQIIAYRIPFSYNAYLGLSKQIDDCMDEFKGDFPGLMCFYGVGNHGGGPTRENIKTIFQKQREYSNIDIVFSSPLSFFSDVRKSDCNLPVVKGDLQHHASGCYSVHSGIKRANRRAENLLLRAEKYNVISNHLLGTVYPADDLEYGWKNVLFNQFHDIIAGTSLEIAYDDAMDSLGEACAIASRLENKALQAISFGISIPYIEGSVPVVIFNPHSWAIKSKIELEWGTFENTQLPKKFTIKDCFGNEIPYQIIEPEILVRNRTRIVFVADIEAMGYALYTIVKSEKPDNYICSSKEPILENDYLRVEFCKETGGISKVYDKIANTQYLSNNAAVGTVINDKSDTWSHNVTCFNDVAGYFLAKQIVKKESGPIRDTVRVISKYEASTLIQEFSLYHNSNQIDVRAIVNWQENLKCLKLDFPLNIRNTTVTYEIPFGTISKPANGEEEPMQNWVDLSGEECSTSNKIGLAILNDCKYSASANDNVVSMMVLRSPVYSHHIPVELTKEPEDYSFIDQGRQTFNYAIVPHVGEWSNAGLIRRGMELNQPATCVVETYHKGSLPTHISFLSVEPENVILTCCKGARDGNGYVIRIYETRGENCTALISLFSNNKKIAVPLSAHEIKTLRINNNGDLVEELDFLEWKKESTKGEL